MPAPTVKEELRHLILRALEVHYTSESSVDKQQTGNHYQSVTLGKMRTKGFRTDRHEFLDKINFQGKRVLDLGCNLGEMSRSARDFGATWVDGYEYDPYFVDIARLVNVHNDVTGVAIYQGDVSDASLYRSHYDIVLAFSVWVYIMYVIEKVAAITDRVLLFETHKLENNLHVYTELIGKYLPYHHVMGYSEWGASLDTKEKRAILLFAHSQDAIDSALTTSQVTKAKA